MQFLCRAAAWLLTTVIVVLSVVPPAQRPVTAASHNLEHLAIFMLMGLAYGLGYRQRPRILALMLLGFCAAIELIQFWIPGRHARLSDFLIDTAAALAGVGIAYILAHRVLPRTWVRD